MSAEKFTYDLCVWWERGRVMNIISVFVLFCCSLKRTRPSSIAGNVDLAKSTNSSSVTDGHKSGAHCGEICLAGYRAKGPLFLQQPGLSLCALASWSCKAFPGIVTPLLSSNRVQPLRTRTLVIIATSAFKFRLPSFTICNVPPFSMTCFMCTSCGICRSQNFDEYLGKSALGDCANVSTCV